VSSLKAEVVNNTCMDGMRSYPARLFFSPWLYWLVKLALGAVFIWSGSVKIVSPGEFADVISRYGLAPEALVPFLAIVLPVVELLAGAALVLEVRGSLAVTAGLLGMFIFVLYFGILKGLDIDCGCFSVEETAEHGALERALLRDLVMVLGVAYLYAWRRFGPRRGPHRGLFSLQDKPLSEKRGL
jgi:uncharacterized membrane protein YphA (DoxX/SURF4 family)